MTENLSGYFFKSHLEHGTFIVDVLRLDHEIDIELLREAWRLTLEECPFFAQGLTEKDGHLFFVPHKSSLETAPMPRCEDGKGIVPRTGELVWVRASDNRMMVGVSHALTDGFGNKVFTAILMYHYFSMYDKRVYPYPFADKEGKITVWENGPDLLENAALERSSAVPEYKLPNEKFFFPDKKASEGENHIFRVSVDAKAFTEAMRGAFALSDEEYEEANRMLLPIGRIPCIFLYLLMGRVIMEKFPDQRKPITLRCPVNVRAPYGREKLLRNCSLPQVVLAMEPEDFMPETEPDRLRNLLADAKRQLSLEHLNWQLARLRKRIETGVPDEALRDMYHQTMLISNVGKQYYEPTPGRVLEDRCYVPVAGCFAMYLSRCGREHVITFYQDFETEEYIRGFLQALVQSGIPEGAIRMKRDQ